MRELRRLLGAKYDFVCGIGPDCGCAGHLIKGRLRRASYPLDWIGSWTLGMATLAKIVADDFAGFLKLENLRALPPPPPMIVSAPQLRASRAVCSAPASWGLASTSAKIPAIAGSAAFQRRACSFMCRPQTSTQRRLPSSERISGSFSEQPSPKRIFTGWE